MRLDPAEEILLIMNSESFLKGLSLSSTPIQSPEDSGYFGSSQKKNLYGSNVKFLNSYSPIKEYASFNNLQNDIHLEQDSGIESGESKINLLDYVNFTLSDLSSDLEPHEVSKLDDKSHDFNSICEPHTSDFHIDLFRSIRSSSQSLAVPENINYERFPYCKTKKLDFCTVSDFKCLVNSSISSSVPLIKHENTLNAVEYKRRLIKVDFIHELKKMNCTSIISSILCYLSAEELCRASCVNKEWRNAILEDKNAKYRRSKFNEENILLLTGPSKENYSGRKFGPPREHKMAFSDLTNKGNSAENFSKKNSISRFDSFIKEAKNGHKLLKCPKCYYPSKCDARKNYICTRCSYNFCGDCFGPIFKHHTCYTFDLPKTFIDSKKSKKNLKRL